MSIRSRLARLIGGKQFGNLSLVSSFPGGGGQVWNPAKNPDILIKKIKGWSYVCIDKNAKAAAQVPLRLYKIQGLTNKSHAGLVSKPIADKRVHDFLRFKLAERVPIGGQLEEVTEHPMLELLRKVNPHQNSYDLKDTTFRYLDAIGAAFWYLERGAGAEIINIWPLLSQHVSIVLNKRNGIKEYKYGRGMNKFTISTDDMMHFRNTSLNNPFVGDSPMAAGEQSIDLNDSMNRYEIGIFNNRGLPDAVLEIPADGGISDDEKKRIESKWRRKFRGVDKAGQMAIVSGGAKLHEFGHSPKEMSYSKGREHTQEETFGVFGVPTGFARPDKISRANLFGMMDLYMNWTINPRLVSVEQKLNEHFTPNWGDNLFLLFDNPRPEDAEFRLKQITSHLASKYTTINEEREKDGLPPVPWGNAPVEPVAPSGQEEEEQPEKPEPKKTDKREGQTNDLPEPDFFPLMFRTMLAITFGEMKSEIIKGIKNFVGLKAGTKQTPEDITSSVFDQQKWQAQLEADIMPWDKGILIQGTIDALEKIDPAAVFNASSPAVATALEKRQGQIKSIITTTEKELRKTLADGIAAGESRSALIKRVRDEFDARSKADRVVRTETIWAHNEGTVIAWKQSGVVSATKWDTVEDDRRCPYCKAMDGKIIGLGSNYFEKGDSFTVKDDNGNDITLKLSYDDTAHPPLHPNCRCQLIPILIED
jgi:HK97 family phage portal protein